VKNSALTFSKYVLSESKFSHHQTPIFTFIV